MSVQCCELQVCRYRILLTLVHHGGKITTIVENHVWLAAVGESSDGLLNAPEVLLFGLTLPGEDGDAAA